MAYQFDRRQYDERMKWYLYDRFGLFLHFGLYSIPARGEWVRSDEEMPEQLYQPYFDEFNPYAFNAHSWARIAREAGMKYAVLTAKHHDGFCLFDTQTTDWKSTKTPFGRDIVFEFLEAFRAEGLKVGLYYSVIDWHHPDFPQYGDRQAPLRNDPKAGSNEGRNFGCYLDYMHEQVRELCTNYGKLDLLWFDFSYDSPVNGLKMRGETWRATELMSMVRELQPQVITNNRLEVSGEGYGSLAKCNPTPYHGDFVTPERIIPPSSILDVEGNPLAWEACITMNDNWGYCSTDTNYKPSSLLIHKLVECVSKGGNLILNVGPDATGRFSEQSCAILKQIGTWMDRNSQSIYGAGISTGGPIEPVRPEWGRITRSNNTYYFHLYENTLGPVPLIGVPKDGVESIRLLRDGSEVKLSDSWTHSDYPDIAFANLGPSPYLPDPVDTVLVVKIKEN